MEKRQPSNTQRNFDLRLRGRLWNRGMNDVADLAGAMRFVMRIAIIVGHYLRAKNEYRQYERYGQQASS